MKQRKVLGWLLAGCLTVASLWVTPVGQFYAQNRAYCEAFTYTYHRLDGQPIGAPTSDPKKYGVYWSFWELLETVMVVPETNPDRRLDHVVENLSYAHLLEGMSIYPDSGLVREGIGSSLGLRRQHFCGNKIPAA